MKDNDHPKGLSECVKKEVYERDHAEVIKDIEEIHKAMDRKKDELQKEINYKSSNNQKLIIWVGAVTLAVSGYLFAQLENMRMIVNDHVQQLGHDGLLEMFEHSSASITSLMCEVFGALC